MPARTCAEMKLAMQYRQEGKGVYESARLAGVSPSALYKALKAKAEKNPQKPLDMVRA